MNRWMIVAGLILVGVGVLWLWLGKIPWFRLPGDIRIARNGFLFYFPITTGIVLSLLISLILWLLRR